MGKRSCFEQIDKDLYRTTDPKPVARLLPWLAPGASFVEPCVGWGDLVGPLMRAGHPCRGRYDVKARYPPYNEDGIEVMKKLLIGPLVPPAVKNAAVLLLAVGVGMKLRSRM